MIITDDHINIIEKELLPHGCDFNDERRAFIKCMETRDVNACAGSGKTTALIAKLVILDRFFMPLPQNKGICVLTHTNVAIDEIKEKLGANAKLLNYPNFFGTIQAFVDKFLAVPMYVKSFQKRPARIDNDWYDDSLDRIGNYLLNDVNTEHWQSAKGWLKNQRDPITLLCKIRFSLRNDDINNLQLLKNFNGENLFQSKSTAYNDFYTIKYNTLFKDRGVLCFDDAYTLANLYIKDYETQLKNLFANRFQFVFIDEMQDSYKHQIDIFDKIFDKQRIIYQCIGDPNQAIFNSVSEVCPWQPNNPLPISDSQRFSTKIANAIQNIRLDNSLPLTGNSIRQVPKEDGTSEEIKPYIIFFEDSQIKEVIIKFKDLIIEHKLHIPEITGQNPEKIKFKAIGWVGQDKDEETSTGQIKHVLKHYFKENIYKKESKTKETCDNLADYLLKQALPKNENGEEQPNASKLYKDAITNAFLKVLRTVGKKQEDEKHYNSTTFWQKVYSDRVFTDKLLSKIISWTKNILQGVDVIEEIKVFICNDLKDFFNYSCSTELNTFISNSQKMQGVNNQKPKNYLEYESDNFKFKIDIATIHSVKGETHTGTLYLETFKDKYETQKGVFKDCLAKKENRSSSFGVQLKETLKMAYVGMSRPTHLLCIAIHKSSLANFERDKQELEEAGWQVIELIGMQSSN
ncbi:MAG: ATP-dependent helicase [Chitinophagales bacterium]|nr:ATP-dependent helicase [Chitinophagales bacterium]